jgi:hypothetical protein
VALAVARRPSLSPTALRSGLTLLVAALLLLALVATNSGCGDSPLAPPDPGMAAQAPPDGVNAPHAPAQLRDRTGALYAGAAARPPANLSRNTAPNQPTPTVADLSGIRLLWVESRGIYCGAGCYGAGGRYRDLLDRYRDLGATIDILAAGAPLDASALAGHAMVWIALPANWDSPFSNAEAAALEAYVAAGGGLELLADGVDTPNENLQPIADRFGIQLGIAPADYYAFTTHSLFGYQLLITSGTATVAGATPWAEDSYTDGIIGVLQEYGAGRMLVLGDANTFTSPSLRTPMGDNALISDSALFWLLQLQEMPTFMMRR